MKKSLLAYSLQAILCLGLAQPSLAVANFSENQTACRGITVPKEQGFALINQSINKSPTDKAIYQGICLANGMEVLLISDEKANKSLMSVGLPIGSMEDPIQQQGLAHYLEHMILMGSKAFPETNSLDGFLTKNGGYNNAYTASDRTIYYLEVNNNAFDEAVARFADTFAEPLLSETNAKKEVNAVNAEMVRAKSSDGFLIHDVNLATANPNHPITKFAVGNNTTLIDKPDSKLQDELVKFYQKYYSANLMRAVLYSNQPIEKLTQLAHQHLGKVTNKNVAVPTVDIPFFREQDKGVVVDYKPVKPTKMLVISFDMPEDKAQFKHKTGSYLAYVLSNNTEGTLSDYLIKQGLSDSGIQANASADVSRNRGDFSIYVELTDKGLAEKDKIISLIFQQIQQLEQRGIQPSYFSELKQSLSQSFEHLQLEKTGNYVASLVSQMIDYPLEHIIDQSYIVEEMDQQAIEAKLAEMTLDKARILVVDSQAKTDQKTRYFEAPYAITKITPEQKAKWLDFSHNPTIKLPELNPYFATDFSLNKVDNTRRIPKLIEHQTGTELFAMPSHYFANEPKARILFDLSISPESTDIKQIISAELLNYMNELAQTKLTFQIAVAGVEGELQLSANGISLMAEGYTQHLARMLNDSLQQFSQFELNETMLAQAKQRYREALDRQAKEGSLKQANQAFADFVAYPYFDEAKQRQMLEQISLADITQARQRLLSQTTGLSVLSVGNLSDEQVENLAKTLSAVIKNNNSKIERGQYIDVSHSQRKLNYIKHVPHEDNALAIAYYPNGYEELDGIARSMLLKDILSRWYFDDLRTDKQLGYVVYATRDHLGKTAGLQFMVQSPNTSPKQIMAHNQRFFKESFAKLNAMSAQEFEKYQASLLDRLQQKPESLAQEYEEFSLDFARGNDKFDRKAKTIALVKALTLPQLIEFYQKAVIDQTGFVFARQAIGTNAQINQQAELEGFERVEDIEKLQQQFERKSY